MPFLPLKFRFHDFDYFKFPFVLLVLMYTRSSTVEFILKQTRMDDFFGLSYMYANFPKLTKLRKPYLHGNRMVPALGCNKSHVN